MTGPFDTFPVQEPCQLSGEDLAWRAFERAVGRIAQRCDAAEILKSSVVSEYGYIAANRAWYVYAGDADPIKFARKLRRALIARSKVPSNVYAVHGVELWIGTSDGRAIQVPK